MSNFSFKDLGVSKDTTIILTKKGYETPTDIQSMLIPKFLGSSDDIIAKADTGTVKQGHLEFR